jgi:hypothetical protein
VPFPLANHSGLLDMKHIYIGGVVPCSQSVWRRLSDAIFFFCQDMRYPLWHRLAIFAYSMFELLRVGLIIFIMRGHCLGVDRE